MKQGTIGIPRNALEYAKCDATETHRALLNLNLELKNRLRKGFAKINQVELHEKEGLINVLCSICERLVELLDISRAISVPAGSHLSRSVGNLASWPLRVLFDDNFAVAATGAVLRVHDPLYHACKLRND